MIRNPWLLAGGFASFLAALLHLACIAGGADWYRAVGAPEALALAAERGELTPHLMTAAIAAVLGLWGAYALSGAGMIARLPLLRTALVLITLIYLLRGAVLIPALTVAGMGGTFNIVSSLIVLVIGLMHLAGVLRAWPDLSRKERFA